MIIKNLGNNRGIIVADALIAILVISIFLGLIGTLTYNIYISVSFSKRNSMATNYGIKIVEHIDEISYDSVIYGDAVNYGLINYINEIDNSNISAKEYNDETITLTTPYKVEVKIEKYNEAEGNIGKQDIIKTITLVIKYNLGENEKELTFERVKKR